MDDIEVELDIFSGRPNPRWLLDGSEARELSALLSRLETGRGRHRDAGLGYRGFVFVSDGERWRAYDGLVVSDPTTLVDREQTVERWLLEHLPEEHQGLYARVLEEIDRDGHPPRA